MDLLLELLKEYGWQAVIIALLTFVLIECVKPLARKFIKQSNIRHVVYTGLNYLISLGLTCVLAAILHRFNDWYTLYGSAIVVINILGPIISNAGFWTWVERLIGDALSKSSERGAWKKAMKELGTAFGVDAAILDTIAAKVEDEYLPLIEKGAELFFTENREELVLNLKQKLAGFADNGKLQELAESLFEKLAGSWKDSKEKKSNSEESK